MEIDIMTTEDGSHSLYVPSLNEHYHSTHGAVQESQHIYIDAGLRRVSAMLGNINLLEVGFGTGLNALLTYFEAMKSGLKINYVSLEPHCIERNVYQQLNYPQAIKEPEALKIFQAMHEKPWNFPHYIHDDFILHKMHAELQAVELANERFDLVYFDAFAPEVQPELWTQEVFQKIYNAMRPESVLVTYCAKGAVKRAMRAVGFEVEGLPGPKGKREITRATK